MAGYKGSPIVQRLLRRQKVRQDTAAPPATPKPKTEKKDGEKQGK